MTKTCAECGKEFQTRGSALTCGPPCRKARARAYEKMRRQTPEYKERHRVYMKAYRQTPESKEYHRVYMKAYSQTARYKENRAARRQTPEYKARKRERRRAKREERATAQVMVAMIIASQELANAQDMQ